jgi:ribonuclease P protein subunit RPP14
MLPRRLEAQLEIALSKPNAIVGSNFCRIPEEATARYSDWCNRLNLEDIYLQRFREVTVIQPTWMVSRERFDLVGGYENGHLLPEDLIFFYKHLSLSGELAKSNEVLLKYRWHAGMTSFKIKRKTLMNYRVKAFEEDILKKDNWVTFTIWSAGRDGKQFYKTLSEENQKRVTAFCDVNQKKIGTSIVLNHTTKHSVPIRQWKDITPPFVCCVALDRYDEFEKNVASLNLKEGHDYFHLV